MKEFIIDQVAILVTNNLKRTELMRIDDLVYDNPTEIINNIQTDYDDIHRYNHQVEKNYPVVYKDIYVKERGLFLTITPNKHIALHSADLDGISRLGLITKHAEMQLCLRVGMDWGFARRFKNKHLGTYVETINKLIQERGINLEQNMYKGKRAQYSGEFQATKVLIRLIKSEGALSVSYHGEPTDAFQPYVRAILSDKYRTIDNIEVASALMPILKANKYEITNTHISEHRMFINATTPRG